MSEVTQLLKAIDQGDPQAAGRLLPLVYEELRKLAAHKMAQEKPGQTLQATALVHEAWLRLTGSEEQQVWNGRGHFFGAAAEAMRRILINRARDKARQRHGGELQRVDFEHVEMATVDNDETVLAVHEALEALARHSPQSVTPRHWPSAWNSSAIAGFTASGGLGHFLPSSLHLISDQKFNLLTILRGSQL